MFFVPTMEGYGLLPRPMVKALSGRRPYFDRLTFPAVRDEDPRSVRIEDIAAALMSQLRRVCPTGPYAFVGFSFGGLVAFEMACQLSDAGEHVDQLILWDAYPVVLEQRSVLAAVASLVRTALSPTGWNDRPRMSSRLHNVKWRVRGLKERLIGTLKGDPVRKATPYRKTFRAALDFRPRPYHGRVHVLTSKQEYQGIFDRLVPARDAWAAVVPPDRLSVVELPCAHDDMLRPPHLDSLIRKTLDILQSSPVC